MGTGSYSLRKSDDFLTAKEIRELKRLYREARHVDAEDRVFLINGKEDDLHYVLIGPYEDREDLNTFGDKFMYKYKELAIDDMFFNYEVKILYDALLRENREGLKAITNFIKEK